MKISILIITIYVIAHISCKHDKVKENRLKTVSKDSLILYHFDSGDKNDKKRFVQNLGALMGMSDLEKGLLGNKECIRIWTFNKKNGYFVINIILNDTERINVLKWSSKQINNRQYITIMQEDMKPKSDWKSFTDTIGRYGIDNIKGGIPYNKQKVVLTEMDPVDFEIYKNKEYTFCEYLQPDFYHDKESNDIYKFLLFLNRELEKQVYSP